MFKASRRKIVAAIMSILILLWVGTLGVIYLSSYLDMTNENQQMLRIHADLYTLPQSPSSIPPEPPMPNLPGHERADSPVFQLSTFYTVALSYSGQVLDLKNDPPTVHTDEELTSLALAIASGTKTSGTKENLAFYLADKNGYLLVTFMDNTVLNENAATLLRYTLVFGAAAILIFFFFSVWIARKIVQPLEISYQKQKQFISDAGHELKTPVSVISANAELLSREIGSNQWLSNIQYENERMGLLVGELLQLARTENLSPQMELLDFSRLTAGETLPFESVAFERNLVLSTNISSNITVLGNSSQLKQLVSILLDNAVRHSSGQSEVYLHLTKEHSYARLAVINQGNPIPAEQRAQLFDRFYRMDDARSGEDSHYGLGLAIAKAIVVSHKGKLDVKCYDGLVEFYVLLPRS